uniref:Uncharacterized protein n=1 Tax=Scophthalmus maximus TaxID=52904 RepID=A0A8D3BNT0_SCOMX
VYFLMVFIVYIHLISNAAILGNPKVAHAAWFNSKGWALTLPLLAECLAACFGPSVFIADFQEACQKFPVGCVSRFSLN